MAYVDLDDIAFNNPDLPVAKPPAPRILAEPSLMAWFTADPVYTDLDGSGRVEAWRCRAGKGTTFEPGSGINRPIPSVESVSGKSSIFFERARADQLKWSGVFPTGTTEDFTKIIIARIDQVLSGSNHLLGNSGSNRNLLFTNNASVQNAIDETADGGPIAASSTITPSWDSPMLLIGSWDASAAVSRLRTVTRTLGVENKTATGTPGISQTGQSLLYLGSTTSAPSTTTTPNMHVLDVMLFNTDLLVEAYADVSSAIQDYALGRYLIGA